MLTYGDGVSDVDIQKLVEFHKSHGKLATMTAIQPEGRFGALDISKNNEINSFIEKPKGDNAWINGCFFVCQPEVLNYINGDETIFEKEPLEKLCETFKAQQDEIFNAVEKQQENLSSALSEIKQLKKQLVKFQIPSWAGAFTTAGSVPFLYKELDDVSSDEIKVIVSELEKIKPGFYLLINKMPNRFGFVAYTSKDVSSKVDLKALSAFLKTTFDLKGGGSAQQIQGGGVSLPANFAAALQEWVKAQTA